MVSVPLRSGCLLGFPQESPKATARRTVGIFNPTSVAVYQPRPMLSAGSDRFMKRPYKSYCFFLLTKVVRPKIPIAKNPAVEPGSGTA